MIKRFLRKAHKAIFSPIKINVNHQYRFIFIHIPKNAGTSMGSTLGFKGTSHATADQVKKKLSRKQFESYFIFTIVRNPWDRFLSLYNYARLEESYYHSAINPKKAVHGKHLDYDILKNASLKDCARLLIKGQLRHDLTWNHWEQQYNWVFDDGGNRLVNYIGRFEDLKKSYEEITIKTGIPSSTIPMINKSQEYKKAYQEYYDIETREIIADYYRKDIEVFKYTF